MSMIKIDAAGHTLRADAAGSYLRMLAAGMPAGGIDIFSRTMAQQQALYDAYRAGKGPVAAKPSPTAPHIAGIAIDAHTTTAGKYAPSEAHRWLTSGGDGSKPSPFKAGVPAEKIRANEHGWTRTVPSERWHFAYSRAADKYRVADLDARLKALGYRDVRAFQAAHSLTADGIDGPLTWAALLTNPKPAAPATAAPALAFGLATWNCGAWGKLSLSAKKITAIVDVLTSLDASVYCLTECPEWLRNHLRGACKCKAGTHRTLPGGVKRWTVRARGSQAILRDSRVWAPGAVGSMVFGPTSYHGGLWETLTHMVSKTAVTVGAYHLPPNVVATKAFQKKRLQAFLSSLPGTRRIAGGDGADDSAWAAGWADARTTAKTSPDRKAPTYKGKSITDRIHIKSLTVDAYQVVGAGGASDHNPVLAHITK